MLSYNPLPHLQPDKGYPIVDVAGWKIYYTDGTIVSSKDVDWHNAPKHEVQIVMLYLNKLDSSGRHCRHRMCGFDFYFKDEEGFGYSFDDSSFVRGEVVYGKWTTYENYNKLFNIAIKDFEF